MVVDLAMPGPERLAGEGVMMGAVPLLSNRWNGASRVDFPGIRKVDHQNAAEVAEAIADVVSNYEEIISSSYKAEYSPAIFLAYITSMWRRAGHTIDTYFGSSFLHFILTPKTLAEEMLGNFHILTILSMFPLASVDLYVRDPLWYIRHHYRFFTILKDAGYIRHDPMDTFEWTEEGSNVKTFVRIKAISGLNAALNDNEEIVNELLPSWKPTAIYFPIGIFFSSPSALFSFVNDASFDKPVLNIKFPSDARAGIPHLFSVETNIKY